MSKPLYLHVFHDIHEKFHIEKFIEYEDSYETLYWITNRKNKDTYNTGIIVNINSLKIIQSLFTDKLRSLLREAIREEIKITNELMNTNELSNEYSTYVASYATWCSIYSNNIDLLIDYDIARRSYRILNRTKLRYKYSPGISYSTEDLNNSDILYVGQEHISDLILVLSNWLHYVINKGIIEYNNNDYWYNYYDTDKKTFKELPEHEFISSWRQP